MPKPYKPLFTLGQVVMTQGIHQLVFEDKLNFADLMTMLLKHQAGDWGEVDVEDREVNDRALATNEHLVSVYTINETRIWVITEADRSSTTILLPEEY